MCKNFNTNMVLRWILILEEYGPNIAYIKGEKNISSDALSRLTNNGNEETTHKTTYTMEAMSELYNIEEFPEGTFTPSFNLIYRYHQ